ncbi:MAG TPA: hypothetical protein VJ728_16040, partial [Candidatus Binataceae bacterium]|nr:hypothetical protein [Candidatus Binataceae bacterium]
MQLSGARVMVIGLGASGCAAAQFLASRGAALVLTDTRSEVATSGIPRGELLLGDENIAWLRGIALVVA